MVITEAMEEGAGTRFYARKDRQKERKLRDGTDVAPNFSH